MAKLPNTPKHRFVIAWLVFGFYGMAMLAVLGILASIYTGAYFNLVGFIPALALSIILLWLVKTGRHVPDNWRTPVESENPEHQRSKAPWE